MSEHSGIEWTDATWNPVAGCSLVSEGCRNCFAARDANRMAGHPKLKKVYEGLTRKAIDGRPVFNGVVRCLPDRLDWPLRKKKPLLIFVNSLSDLFHPEVPFEFVDKVFAVMALCPQHTFQVLTKRPERMREYFAEKVMRVPQISLWGAARLLGREATGNAPWPLPNVWLMTSIENQNQIWRADELLHTPAAIRGISAEPLLGDLNFGPMLSLLDWVIAGGESGPNARPMHPDWVRSIRDQCQAAGVPFLFKQWGKHVPWVDEERLDYDGPEKFGHAFVNPDGTHGRASIKDEDGWVTNHTGEMKEGAVCMAPVGKKAAGRELDGRIWDEYPTTEGG